MGDRGELSTAFYGLLKSKGLTFPDARPLYSYRFARADYDEVSSILRRFGPSAVFERHGAALIVCASRAKASGADCDCLTKVLIWQINSPVTPIFETCYDVRPI